MSCIEDTDSIDLEIVDGNLSAEIIISPQPNNQAEVLPDGLFVGLSVPPGVVAPYAGATAPDAWLLADGAAVNRSTYADLFDVIGTLYGIGDGSTTFNLPSIKGRVPVGRDAAQGEFDGLGETGGEKTHALTSQEIEHQHGTVGIDSAGGVADTFPAIAHFSTSDGGTLLTTAHNNLQPYIALNYIIKT